MRSSTSSGQLAEPSGRRPPPALQPATRGMSCRKMVEGRTDTDQLLGRFHISMSLRIGSPRPRRAWSPLSNERDGPGPVTAPLWRVRVTRSWVPSGNVAT